MTLDNRLHKFHDIWQQCVWCGYCLLKSFIQPGNDLKAYLLDIWFQHFSETACQQFRIYRGASIYILKATTRVTVSNLSNILEQHT